MIRPTAGVVRIGGSSQRKAGWKTALGYLPEHSGLFGNLTVTEFIVYGGRLGGIDRPEGRARGLMERLGLGAFARERLHNLSKGVRQRVGLAQALINDPKILLLDEPMSGLDPQGRRMARELIGEARSAGATIILSSHNLLDVEALADEVVLLVGGRVVAGGLVATLLQDPSAGLEVEVIGVDAARFSEATAKGLRADLTGNVLRLSLPDDQFLPELTALVRSGGGHIVSVRQSRHSLEDWYIARMTASSPLLDAHSLKTTPSE